jgi:hypothetical protein
VTGLVFVGLLRALRADRLPMIPMKFLSISTHFLRASMSCMNAAAPVAPFAVHPQDRSLHARDQTVTH